MKNYNNNKYYIYYIVVIIGQYCWEACKHRPFVTYRSMLGSKVCLTNYYRYEIGNSDMI